MKIEKDSKYVWYLNKTRFDVVSGKHYSINNKTGEQSLSEKNGEPVKQFSI